MTFLPTYFLSCWKFLCWKKKAQQNGVFCFTWRTISRNSALAEGGIWIKVSPYKAKEFDICCVLSSSSQLVHSCTLQSCARAELGSDWAGCSASDKEAMWEEQRMGQPRVTCPSHSSSSSNGEKEREMKIQEAEGMLLEAWDTRGWKPLKSSMKSWEEPSRA